MSCFIRSGWRSQRENLAAFLLNSWGRVDLSIHKYKRKGWEGGREGLSKLGTNAHICIKPTSTHTPAHLCRLPSQKVKMWFDLNNDRCVCQGCGCHFKSMDGSIFPGRLSTSEGLTGYTALQCGLKNSELSKWLSGSPVQMSAHQEENKNSGYVQFLLLFHDKTLHRFQRPLVNKKTIIWASICLMIISTNTSKNQCFRDIIFKQVAQVTE